MTHHREDLTDEGIAALLVEFYEVIGRDTLLAPYFAAIDIAAHIPRIADFWSTIVFHSGRYSGNAFKPHLEMPGLTAAHFARWVETLERTVDARFEGPNAELMKSLGHRIAYSMQVRLGIPPFEPYRQGEPEVVQFLRPAVTPRSLRSSLSHPALMSSPTPTMGTPLSVDRSTAMLRAAKLDAIEQEIHSRSPRPGARLHISLSNPPNPTAFQTLVRISGKRDDVLDFTAALYDEVKGMVRPDGTLPLSVEAIESESSEHIQLLLIRNLYEG